MTIEISLKDGYSTIIDDEDAELAEMTWRLYHNPKSKTLYAHGNYGSLHRYVYERMTGVWLKGNLRVIDHIDRNGLNNLRSNLRLATNGQNIANRELSIVSRSGFRGVRQSPNGRWVAKVAANHLGTFDTIEEAVAAYHKAAKERWGEFYNPQGSNS